MSRLEALGHEVVECPLIEIEPLRGRSRSRGYDWVIVTSPNGARELVSRARGELPKVAAVGPGTAETLRELGVEPAFVPRVSSQDGLLAEFPRAPAGARALRRRRGRAAGRRGARRRLRRRSTRRGSSRPTAPPEGDLVVLASGSAARAFAELGVDIPAVTIGPQTTRRRAAGCRSSPRRRRTISTASSARPWIVSSP